MKPIKIIQIGLSHDHGTLTLDVIAKQKEYFDLLGVVATKEDREMHPDFVEATVKKGYKLIPEEKAFDMGAEAFAVETEDEFLTVYAQKVAERGYPLHVDKPGTQDLEAFEKFIATVKEKGVELQMGYMYRNNPVIKKVLADAKAGKFGRIYSVEANMDCKHNASKRNWLAKYKGGMTYYLGCHLVDLIYSIMGKPQKVVPMNVCTGFDGAKGEDMGFVAYQYENGVASLHVSACECGGFTRRGIVISGEKATVHVKTIENFIDPTGDCAVIDTKYRIVDVNDNEKDGWAAYGKEYRSEPFNRYGVMMEDFAKIVRKEIKNEYTPDYELETFRLLLQSCDCEVKK